MLVRLSVIAILLAAVVGFVFQSQSRQSKDRRVAYHAESATAILAGGCFWCVESDFEKLDGVTEVISGYSGGSAPNPSYANYSASGHREVVLVKYDPLKVTYSGLVEWLLKHIDPTDGNGSFHDRGQQYAPAIYYQTDEQRLQAENVMAAVNNWNVFNRPLAVKLEAAEKFWPAEEDHQDYNEKNYGRYSNYRKQSGRDAFIEKHWGERANTLELDTSLPQASESLTNSSWNSFRKPTTAELRQRLTDIQYQVTQQDGTERAFKNSYWDNKLSGIYVDVVSGEPLFSSTDKYKSGTGWPSFVKPLRPEIISLHQDHSLFASRIEVRSKIADSHLGHVFDDGPRARGGKRYCMNSAALRFVPKSKMESQGYGEFLADVK